MKISRFYKNHAVHLMITLAMIISTLAAPISAGAEAVNETSLNWIQGTGLPVPVGEIAQLQLQEDYAFLNGADTKAYIREYGQIPSDQEIGAVFPIAEDQYWIAYFEYIDSGHISDDEKTKIDVDALLDSFIKGTEEANKEVLEENQLFVDGWDVPPVYNESLRSLTWSLLLHDNEGNKIINYHIRILTREGYMSVILASDPEHLATDRQTLEQDILPNLVINQGKTYEDFDPSIDKKSSIGLTGLILGGAGLAVAKKAGLIGIIAIVAKKLWFIIFLPFIWIYNLIRGKGKSKNKNNVNDEANHHGENPAETHANPEFENDENSRFKSKFDIENENKKPPTSV
ncbi:hypothetical protein D3C76_947430 [compost metagenome]